MSSTVDERIVDMQFNNQQFEKNVHQSIDTIGDLKKSLNFSNVSDGVGEINRSIGKISFDPLASGLNSIGNKFSILETIAVGALLRIGQKAEDLGEKLVTSLTIDQVSAGWDKYANKTDSVATIMAATAQDFEDTGKQMEYVNGQLDKLNWFTDETSYNFVDMTSNIGKFTSQGMKLEDSVQAMEGIATWAALSGAKAGEASRAMYNLSQSLGQGAVKLMDWKSIQNVNMDTVEFKKTVMETAKELGRLDKGGKILKNTAQKYVGDDTVNIQNFASTLSAGWFDNEVLMKSLEKYGKFSNELSKVSDKTGLTASELLDSIDDYKAGTLDLAALSEETGVAATELEKSLKYLGSTEFELGRKAFKAAQEARTFRDAIDATKDAVSTGWMKTFEIIFGDYEEAKALWTAMAEELYDIFAEPINARNRMLTKWKELGGQKAMLEALKNAWLGLKGVVGTAQQAFRRLFPKMTAERLVQLTEGFKELTSKMIIGKETGEKLGTIFRGLFAPLSIAWQGVKALVEVIGELIDIVKRNVKTNIKDWDQVKEYIPYAFKFDTDNIESENIPGDSTRIPAGTGLWFFLADDIKTEELVKELFKKEKTNDLENEEGNTTDRNTTTNIASTSNITSKTETSSKDIINKSKIKVEILNGSGDSSLLTKATKALKEEGYNVYKTGKSKNVTQVTTIINKSKLSESITSNLKSTLGTGVISSSSTDSKVDVTIILGKDYKK